jgi:hypothetical protein
MCCLLLLDQRNKGVNIFLRNIFDPFTDEQISEARDIISQRDMNTTFDAFNLSGNDSAAAAVSRSSCSGSSYSSTASIFESSNNSSTSSIAAADVAATPPSSEDWLCTSVGQLSLSESLSGQSLIEWLSESNSFCGCNSGLCIDKSCKNYRRGKEYSTLSCHNSLCLN